MTAMSDVKAAVAAAVDACADDLEEVGALSVDTPIEKVKEAAATLRAANTTIQAMPDA